MSRAPVDLPSNTFVLTGVARVDDFGRRRVGDLSFQGGRVCGVGVEGQPARQGYRMEAGGHLAFPGLINAHDHLHLNGFPSLAYGSGLAPAFDDVAEWVDALRRRIVEPDFLAVRRLPLAARLWLGGLKNLLAGTTVVLHHDPIGRRAARALPLTVPARPWAHSLDLAGSYGPPLGGLQAPATDPTFVHLAEGRGPKAAAEWWRLAALGLVGGGLRVIHGLGLKPEDRRRLLGIGAGLVACPVSNQRLFGRVASVRDLAARGRAALGTDSRLTGARDLLAELGFARQVGLATAESLLRMVGVDAARLCGLPRQGRLTPGMAADAILLRDDGRAPAEQLCNSARADLRLVIRRGVPVVADLDFADLFAAQGLPAQRATLDGRPKLVARSLADPLRAWGLVEPGLDIDPAG